MYNNVCSKLVHEFLPEIESGDAIAFVWTADDVSDALEGLDVVLSREDARRVLATLWQRYDASEGMNWDVIQSTAHDMYRHGEIGQQEEDE